MKFESLLIGTKLYQTVLKDKHKGELNHSYMLVSDDKLAIESLCVLVARAILCGNDGCGDCIDCRAVENNRHLALTLLNQEKISVEDVQDLISTTYSASQKGEIKVYIIQNANIMSADCQNKLLKTLEEPSDNVIFILGVTKPDAMLSTVKSRCKKIDLEKFSRQELESEMLKINTDTEKVAVACACAFGSLTRADSLIKDNTFSDKFKKAVDGFAMLASSRDILAVESFLGISKVEQLNEYLDIFESIMRVLMNKLAGDTDDTFKDVDKLLNNYNLAVVANIEELIIQAREKVERNCQINAVLDSLFLKITEVKYKCR